MATINIEFFALPEELLGLLQSFDEVSSSWKTLVRLRPDFAIRLLPAESPLVCPPGEQFNRICLTTERPLLPAESAYDFLVNNQDALVIDIGEREAGSLRASVVGARTEDATSVERWKSIAKHLKKMTHAGLWVRNPQTGAKSFARSFRFSEGARTFSQEGGLLRPIAGWNVFSVEEPPG